jgi:hypothetical protein
MNLRCMPSADTKARIYALKTHSAYFENIKFLPFIKFYVLHRQNSYFQADSQPAPFLPTKHCKWHILAISRDISDVKRVV